MMSEDNKVDGYVAVMKPTFS